jgi:hypothetical protein
MARFTATHGVHLADLDVQFVYDAEATGNSSEKVYAYETDDDKIAGALLEVDDYGITAAPADSDDKAKRPTKKAAAAPADSDDKAKRPTKKAAAAPADSDDKAKETPEA